MPLSCGLISSYSQSLEEIKENYNIEILMLDDTLENMIDEMEDPVVIGVSCYAWNFYGCVELSKGIREKYPDVILVWGGPMIPNDEDRIEEFSKEHQYVDIIVHMEGEITFSDILIKIINNESYNDCHGTTMINESGFKTNISRDRITDFTIVPSPYLNGIFDRILTKYKNYIVGALWETSRGCPFKCSFCDWGNSSVNKVNRLEVDRCLKEIEWVSKNNLNYVYATDANFGIGFKRDMEIAKGFVKIANSNGFPNTLVLNWTKNSSQNIIELADVLNKGKVTTNVTLSYQSFHPPVLEAIQRKNIKLSYMLELKKMFHDRGLATYTELILGLPQETMDTFIAGIDKIYSPNIKDQVSIYLCVILENTHLLRSQERYGIQTSECAVGLNRRKFKFKRFGVDNIVVGTNAMPTKDWERTYDVAFLFLCLHNLRVAYFVILYLKYNFDIKVTDFVKFILDNSEKYSSFDRAVKHLKHNRQLIRDGVNSVSEVEGSDGVNFTPHEAITFLLLNNFEETYENLYHIVKDFLREQNIEFNNEIMQEVIKYSKIVIPVFKVEKTKWKFNTNIPMYFYNLSTGREVIDITPCDTDVEVRPQPHDYKDELEYNLRRVACGYTLNLSDIYICDKLLYSDKTVKNRNLNLGHLDE